MESLLDILYGPAGFYTDVHTINHGQLFFPRFLCLHLEKVQAIEWDSNLPSVLNIHIVRLNDFMHKNRKWKAATSECKVFEDIVWSTWCHKTHSQCITWREWRSRGIQFPPLSAGHTCRYFDSLLEDIGRIVRWQLYFVWKLQFSL